MFNWFENTFCSNLFQNLRSLFNPYYNILPDWTIYSLPDGLWLFSYMALMLLIWKNKVNNNNAFWIFSVPLLVLCHEFGQLFKIFPGTFDIADIIFYLFGILLPLTLFTFKRKQLYNEEAS